MKSKKTLCTLLIAMFALSAISTAGTASADWTIEEFTPTTGTWMSINNYTLYDEANLTGTRFNITVDVKNVADLGSFDLFLYWDTSLLNATRVYPTAITENAEKWLPIDGGYFHWDGPPTINNTIGRVWVYSLFKLYPFTGSGPLMTIEFEILLAPPRETVTVAQNKTVSCPLDLGDTECYLYDTGANEIPMSVHDGLYTYIRPQKLVGEPTAVCTVTPSTVYVGDTVTFDGTASDDGGAPPLTYAWDVDSDGTVNATGATVVWPCPAAGTFNVTLTVTNNMGLSDTSAPQYWTVKEKLGPIIDLYTSTNRWCGVDTEADMVGKGDDMPCDALSPDVNVTFYAEVTYNGAPVNHVFVAFEILWEWQVDWYNQEVAPVPKNQCVLYATAETNKDGIAQISFRVPTSCDPTEYIGKWFAMAKCKVQEVPIEDTMRFDVGYLIIMYDIEVLREVEPDTWEPDTTFVREVDSLGVMVYAKSIAWIPRFAKFIVVVYDECNVPLGQFIVGFDVPAGDYCDPMHMPIPITGISIPQWAYVGMGRVEVSVFTELPHDCGVPYSKGISADIEITWAG